MGKIKYLLKRIINMNFDNFFNTINEISIKTNKPKYKIFFDIVSCGMKYQAGYSDYKLYEMYNLNNKQRKTIVTRGYNNNIIKKYTYTQQARKTGLLGICLNMALSNSNQKIFCQPETGIGR